MPPNPPNPPPSDDHAELDTSGWDPRVRAIYDYWRSIRGPDRRAPARADFDPLAVPQLLEWLWLLDVQHDPLRFRFRLLGTRHVEAMKGDFTGQWIDEAFPHVVESDSYAAYVQVVQELKPNYRKGKAHYHVPDYRTIERILLPIGDEDGGANMVLGLTVYHDRIGWTE
jgi:hypothetical protein